MARIKCCSSIRCDLGTLAQSTLSLQLPLSLSLSLFLSLFLLSLFLSFLFLSLFLFFLSLSFLYLSEYKCDPLFVGRSSVNSLPFSSSFDRKDRHFSISFILFFFSLFSSFLPSFFLPSSLASFLAFLLSPQPVSFSFCSFFLSQYNFCHQYRF